MALFVFHAWPSNDKQLDDNAGLMMKMINNGLSIKIYIGPTMEM